MIIIRFPSFHWTFLFFRTNFDLKSQSHCRLTLFCSVLCTKAHQSEEKNYHLKSVVGMTIFWQTTDQLITARRHKEWYGRHVSQCHYPSRSAINVKVTGRVHTSGRCCALCTPVSEFWEGYLYFFLCQDFRMVMHLRSEIHRTCIFEGYHSRFNGRESTKEMGIGLNPMGLNRE